jgi:hypothetical protein
MVFKFLKLSVIPAVYHKIFYVEVTYILVECIQKVPSVNIGWDKERLE